MKPAVFTPEQKNLFKGYCIISDNALKPIGELCEVTRESFRALWIDNFNNLQELTVDDFEYFNSKNKDNDFKITENGSFVLRSCIPEEILEILDAVAKEKMAAESE